MDYKEIKKELSLTDADISEFFDYKNANSFATSSAKNRIEKGLATFYTHSKKAWEEKMKGLKLFIWKDVLANYTSGIANAIVEQWFLKSVGEKILLRDDIHEPSILAQV
ncbi:hypothetical protein [uncultured Winogradskyella sp.]|uniref:hypothetical protein n=1 Tax=uncultured Winogradskyella sp. TaxID=395353 RepID=UPI00262D8D2D|nr:hypothetical protein [uncultured Winogradskyella sp.]